MISFILMTVLGAAQFLVLKMVISAIFETQPVKMILWFLLKLAIYGSVIPIVFFVLKDNILISGIGLAIGMVISAFGYAIYKNMKKGDDVGEGK